MSGHLSTYSRPLDRWTQMFSVRLPCLAASLQVKVEWSSKRREWRLYALEIELVMKPFDSRKTANDPADLYNFVLVLESYLAILIINRSTVTGMVETAAISWGIIPTHFRSGYLKEVFATHSWKGIWTETRQMWDGNRWILKRGSYSCSPSIRLKSMVREFPLALRRFRLRDSLSFWRSPSKVHVWMACRSIRNRLPSRRP